MRSFARFCIAVAFVLATCVVDAQEPPADAVRENLGPAINTPSIEILPIVSPDGSTLYFDRKYDPANVGGARDQDDIWFSTRQADGTWSPARNIGAPLNTPGSDVLFWISPDGATALVHHGAEVSSGTAAGMAIARRRDGAWQTPQPIRIEGVASLGESYYAQVTPDGRHLLLAYAADTSRPRDLDIFVCDAIGRDLIAWGRPRTLGGAINTSGFDGAPFLAADARTLYFATDGRGGIGSSDLFVARRSDTGWTSWSTPENLGTGINTPRFEASLSIAADARSLYVSGSGTAEETNFGKADIYRIPLPEPYRPAVVLTVDGRLLAAGRGVRGLVRAERTSDGREVVATVSEPSGRFVLTLPAGEQYRITGGADGYTEGTADVDGRGIQTSTTVSTTIRVGAVTRAETPRAEPQPEEIGIGFDSGDDELSAAAIRGLERALATIRRDAGAGRVTRVIVRGHTDDVGDEQENVELSRRRAENVRSWLLARGIDASLVTVEALGESAPLAPNTSASARRRNRRVEVIYDVVTATPRREN